MNEILKTIEITKWRFINNDKDFNFVSMITNELEILYAIIESTPEAKNKYQTVLAIRKMQKEKNEQKI